MHRAFVDRERRDHFAAGDFRKPLSLGRVRSAEHDRARRSSGRGQRRNGEIAAKLLQHQPERQITERRATEFLGDHDAGQPHFGQRAPRGRIIALYRSGRAQLPERSDGRFIIGPFAHHIAQHCLFVVQCGHVLNLLSFSLSRFRGRSYEDLVRGLRAGLVAVGEGLLLRLPRRRRPDARPPPAEAGGGLKCGY